MTRARRPLGGLSDLLDHQRLWWNFATLGVGRSRWAVLLVAGLSLVAGFVEASALFLVIRSAAALAGGDQQLGALPLLGQPTPSEALSVSAVLICSLIVITTVNTSLIASMAARLLTVVRIKLLRGFLETSWDVQASEPEGAIQEYAVVQPERAALGFVSFSNQIAAFANFVVFVALGLAADLRAAAFCVTGGLLVIISFRSLKRRTHAIARNHVDASRNLSSRIAEMTRVAMEIRVLGVTPRVGDRLAGEVRSASIPYRRARFFVPYLPRLYQHVALALIVAVVFLMTVTGEVRATSVGAAIILLVRAMSYAQQGQTASQMMREVEPNAADIRDRISRYGASKPVFGSLVLGPVERLELRDVVYEYPDGTRALDTVSLDIERGEIVGVVGPSGSGKSTLVQVILGLRRPMAGQYTVNGAPAEEYERISWCRRFAFVPQEARLIRGTVAENVLFDRTDVDTTSVEEALRKAQLTGEVERLPNGLHTELGIGARAMSGGQEQRLGIARALVTSPSVLVLDEPTSSLDPAREKRFIEELERRQPGTTVIIVTHRPSSLIACDRVLEMHEGRLAPAMPPAPAETGTEAGGVRA